jgi:antitoxin (DNA-binding transcriptional repressor) of toxin-antitoxin stability system
MCGKMSESLSGMRKMAARQFQKQFSKLAETLKPGDVVQVTKHGEPLVRVTKLGHRQIKTPNFMSYLAPLRYREQLGDRILKEFNNAAVALSLGRRGVPTHPGS